MEGCVLYIAKRGRKGVDLTLNSWLGCGHVKVQPSVRDKPFCRNIDFRVFDKLVD
jgi:hypothetical protein